MKSDDQLIEEAIAAAALNVEARKSVYARYIHVISKMRESKVSLRRIHRDLKDKFGVDRDWNTFRQFLKRLDNKVALQYAANSAKVARGNEVNAVLEEKINRPKIHAAAKESVVAVNNQATVNTQRSVGVGSVITASMKVGEPRIVRGTVKPGATVKADRTEVYNLIREMGYTVGTAITDLIASQKDFLAKLEAVGDNTYESSKVISNLEQIQAKSTVVKLMALVGATSQGMPSEKRYAKTPRAIKSGLNLLIKRNFILQDNAAPLITEQEFISDIRSYSNRLQGLLTENNCSINEAGEVIDD